MAGSFLGAKRVVKIKTNTFKIISPLEAGAHSACEKVLHCVEN
jgi:hypothetical protein